MKQFDFSGGGLYPYVLFERVSLRPTNLYFSGPLFKECVTPIYELKAGLSRYHADT